MKKQAAGIAAAVGLGLTGWLLLAPIPIEPVAWVPPADPGYVGPFLSNTKLASATAVSTGGREGPEDLALDAEGRLYTATHSGDLLRYDDPASAPVVIANTGGRPLGLEVHPDGRLLVADAHRGLLAVDLTTGAVSVLCDRVAGVPVAYADDVDVDPQGRIWFTDASTKFSPEDHGGTFPASLLEIFEHRGNGRVIVLNADGTGAFEAATGIVFANGIARHPDNKRMVVVESGSNRLLSLPADLTAEVRPTVWIDALPGFPDNIQRDGDLLWVGLVSGRSPPADALAPYPGVRGVVQRLPKALRPDAVPYGHVFGVRGDEVVVSLQDPAGSIVKTTGALRWRGGLWVSSLTAPSLYRLPAAALELSGS